MMDDILSPATLAGVLRQWLSEWPDKVLFGTDAFDGGVEQGWEQVAWVGSTTARRALAIALTKILRRKKAPLLLWYCNSVAACTALRPRT